MKKLLVLFLTVMMVVGCSSSPKESEVETVQESESSETISVDKLVLTYVTSPLNVPSIIDKVDKVTETAFEGVEIEYAEITSGSEQTQALASGDVQILHAVGGSSIVAAAAAGMDIKIINMYSRAPEAFTMYSKDENINSPSDLKGKIIGGPFGTNLHELLVSYLKAEGLTLEDVNFVNMSIPDALAGLDGGSVDVALLGGPAGYNAGQAGYHKITDGKGLIEAIIAVATTSEYYEAHKDVIDKFEEVQKEVRNKMKNDPEGVKELVMEALNLTPEAFDAMYPQYDFTLEVSDKDIEGLQKTADFMFESEMIETEVDVKELFIK